MGIAPSSGRRGFAIEGCDFYRSIPTFGRNFEPSCGILVDEKDI